MLFRPSTVTRTVRVSSAGRLTPRIRPQSHQAVSLLPFRAAFHATRQAQEVPDKYTFKTTEADPHARTGDKTLYEYGKHLTSMLPRFIQQYSVWKDELTLYVAPSGLIPVVRFLRDHTGAQYKQLVETAGADYPSRTNRFEVVHHFLSVRYNTRIRVKTYCDEVTPVPSLAELYNSAIWFEREAYDMYGILFTNHPDLRRILTDYGFEGHPLRKDFPITGYVEVRYDDERKRVVTEPVEMTQAFRNFDYSSAWEQTGHGRDDAPKGFERGSNNNQ
ncbi:putative NADH-ubiquinone oxidoreductase 30.4 kDa subunit, mitochondrial [Dimargaris verticillata]|uniref:NADH-ubiquinone oxidoreductase 30.4 kDa subunit, mitochondrial n=1 Tax=Dimargaris verticillata TaxID=2761393 RepID=A0A9W8B312_9FUNG|nr:putative NADH-ubiquinone oxidoreductase 30.4 kDa subunit, mitochondrial [Dimargaris verticillata]